MVTDAYIAIVNFSSNIAEMKCNRGACLGADEAMKYENGVCIYDSDMDFKCVVENYSGKVQ